MVWEVFFREGEVIVYFIYFRRIICYKLVREEFVLDLYREKGSREGK